MNFNVGDIIIVGGDHTAIVVDDSNGVYVTLAQAKEAAFTATIATADTTA